MTVKLYALPVILVALFSSCAEEKEEAHLRLWYDEPAEHWMAALPVGNGNFGAMVYGKPNGEIIHLNHDEFWSGYPRDLTNPEAAGYASEVARLVAARKYTEANELIDHLQGPYSEAYQPLGDLLLETGHEQVTDYYRDLDLSDAIARVRYQADGIKYSREIFTSFPGQVMAMKLTASEAGGLNFSLSLKSLCKNQLSWENGTYKMVVQAPKHSEPGYRNLPAEQAIIYDDWDGEGTKAQVDVQVLARDGQVSFEDGRLTLKNGKEAVVLISAATSFNGPFKSPGLAGKDYAAIADSALRAATSKTWSELRAIHIDDYKTLFDRVKLQLGVPWATDSLPTDRRIISFKANEDPNMVSLLYQYGRYLLIASSRPGTQAANLQGIWNQSLQPPWSSNYTQNINLQMNYWPAESTNLSELTEPLMNLIKSNAVKGKDIAQSYYGLEGWVSHHNGDIWAHCCPVGDNGTGDPVWANWSMGGVWMLNHVWDHYLFTGDREFLAGMYPSMKGAARFLTGMLRENKNGFVETAFGTSPENKFLDPETGKAVAVCAGPACDLAMTNELLNNCLKAASTLEVDPEFQQELTALIPKLQPFRINDKGILMEWNEDFEETEPQHRHLSHLYGFHPGNQINVWDTPELFMAVKNSLLRRGDEATGWSMGWKANMWARMLDGDHALKIIQNLFSPIGFGPERKGGGGGLYANMLDAHPPFQIDGNFGVTAGITEMLLQSHAGAVHLLPALPSAWQKGSVSGLKARGAYTVDIRWDQGELQQAVIHSQKGGKCRIRSEWKLDLQEINALSSGGGPLMETTAVPKPEIQGRPDLQPKDVRTYYLYEVEIPKGQSLTVNRVQVEGHE